MTISQTKRANANVGADSATWGDIIISEVCQRLPKVQPFIQEYRTIYSNKEGEGLGIIILWGAKAFIPAIVKKWTVQPMDVVVYKKGSDLKCAFLSERSLVSLLTSASLGTPVMNNEQMGFGDQRINLNGPGGSLGARNGTMGAASGVRSKMASLILESIVGDFAEVGGVPNLFESDLTKEKFATEEIQSYAYWKSNPKLVEMCENKPWKSKSSSILIAQNDSDEWEIFTNDNTEGQIINEDQVERLLSTEKDPNVRMQKAASLQIYRSVIVGNQLNRDGNILMGPEDQTRLTRHEEPSLPAKEGIFFYGREATYINPSLKYLDGSPCLNMALGVRKGKFDVSGDMTGFISYTGLGESADLSREELLPDASHLQPGDLLTIYNIQDGSCTVPFKLLMKYRTETGLLSMRVVPLYGEPSPILIEFYNGRYVKPVGDDTILYPILCSRVCALPPRRSSLAVMMDTSSSHPIHVEVVKGGSHSYSIKENGKFIRVHANANSMIAALVYRYGMSLDQATAFVKDLSKTTSKRFSARTTNLSPNGSEMSSVLYDLPVREKDAIRKGMKLASSLSSLPTIYEDDAISASQLDSLFSSFMTKIGAVGGSPSNDPTQNGQAAPTAGGNIPGNTGGAQSGGLGILDYLLNVRPVSKDTQEVIDLLTYFAMGKFKKDEGLDIITKLEGSLLEVENFLCKLLLLVLFGRVPGMQYSDTKLLLSDLDSFLSTILSSRVLLKRI